MASGAWFTSSTPPHRSASTSPIGSRPHEKKSRISPPSPCGSWPKVPGPEPARISTSTTRPITCSPACSPTCCSRPNTPASAICAACASSSPPPRKPCRSSYPDVQRGRLRLRQGDGRRLHHHARGHLLERPLNRVQGYP